MNDTDHLNRLILEVGKLEKHWVYSKWITIISSIALIILGFVLMPTVLVENDTRAFPYPLLISAIGAAMLGAILRNWSGTKELKLLRKFKHYHDNAR